MPERDVERELSQALREAAGESDTGVTASDVFARISHRKTTRPIVGGALMVVLVVVSGIALVTYLNLPTPRIASVSPTPSVPGDSGSPKATPVATTTPGATEPAASAAATTTPGPSATGAATNVPEPTPIEPSSWQRLVWTLPPADAFGGPGNQYLVDVVPYLNGFVGVGYDMGGAGPYDAAIWTSSDGYAWERLPLTADQSAGNELRQVVLSSSGLIAYGDAAMLASADGREWQRVDYNIGGVVRVERAADGFFGRPLPGEDVLHDLVISADGLTWSTLATGGLDDFFLNSVSFTPVGYFAVGYDRDREFHSWRSEDGTTWEPFELEPGVAAKSVWAMDPLIYAYPDLCTQPNDRCGAIVRLTAVYRSTDGATWTKVALPDQAPYRFGDHIYWSGRWMVGVPGNLRFGEPLLLSNDGLTWQSVESLRSGDLDMPQALFPDFNRIVLGADGILAVGHEGTDGPAGVEPFVWYAAADDSVGPIETFPSKP